MGIRKYVLQQINLDTLKYISLIFRMTFNKIGKQWDVINIDQ
jgi:hypothetical protein